MVSKISGTDTSTPRSRRRLTTSIRDSLRELTVQLSLLNHNVGARLGLKDVDIDCMDLIARLGPLSPSTLARLGGLHPATMTGVLDRLEKGGWVTRERDPSDRRAILVSARRERSAAVFALYAGMNASMESLLAEYDPEQLQTIHDFLRRTVANGQTANESFATP